MIKLVLVVLYYQNTIGLSLTKGLSLSLNSAVFATLAIFWSNVLEVGAVVNDFAGDCCMPSVSV